MPKMFAGDLEFLSNFHMQPFEMPGLGMVPSSEHAFNALKTTDPAKQAWVLAGKDPQEAKNRGRKVPLRPDWDTGFRFLAMQAALRGKFRDPGLRAALVATGDLILVETNSWHDNFWGKCLGDEPSRTPHNAGCHGFGKNMLGEMLMALRAGVNNSA